MSSGSTTAAPSNGAPTSAPRSVVGGPTAGSGPNRRPPRLPLWVAKLAMAVSGIIWGLFVLVHTVGNLKAYTGAESFNHYAEFLREVGDPLFSYGQLLMLLRVVTVTSILVHIWAAYTLYQMARRAHGSNYAVKRVVQANYATRFMRIGGRPWDG